MTITKELCETIIDNFIKEGFDIPDFYRHKNMQQVTSHVTELGSKLLDTASRTEEPKRKAQLLRRAEFMKNVKAQADFLADDEELNRGRSNDIVYDLER